MDWFSRFASLKKIVLFIYILIFSCAGSSLLFGASWNFFGMCSIGGWLNLWLWDPWMQRADCLLLLSLRFPLVAGSRGYSSCGVWASNCCDSSCCRAGR